MAILLDKIRIVLAQLSIFRYICYDDHCRCVYASVQFLSIHHLKNNLSLIMYCETEMVLSIRKHGTGRPDKITANANDNNPLKFLKYLCGYIKDRQLLSTNTFLNAC